MSRSRTNKGTINKIDRVMHSNNVGGDNKVKIAVSSENNNIKNNNNIVKNSNNHKIIPRNRNRKPKLKKTIESGYYASIANEVLDIRSSAPSIRELSFIRPNLEKLIGEEVVMVAYVDSKRTTESRAKYVLETVCSVESFLSDHLIVDDCVNNSLQEFVGEVIQFVGIAYRYGDKVSVKVTQPKKVKRNSKGLYLSNTLPQTEKDFDIARRFLTQNTKNINEQILNKFIGKLNHMSGVYFGSTKFIVGLISSMHFMSTKNEIFSQLNPEAELFNNGDDKLNLLIIGHIIYMMELGLIKDYNALEREIFYISSNIIMTPTLDEYEEGDLQTISTFKNYCISLGIKECDIFKKLKMLNKNHNIEAHRKFLSYEMNRSYRSPLSGFVHTLKIV